MGVLRSLDVTRGTDDDTFTPFAFVDRGQMASFIGRALGVVATAPATDADFFADDEEHTHENAINALASIGVVQGTEPGRYAPDRPVTRGQMAAFLLRSLEYAVDQGHVTAVAPWQDAADLEASCVLTPTDDQPDLPSVALRHPSGWERGNDTVGSCRYFDPEPIDIPTDTEVFGVDVRWDIDAVDFGRASQPSDDERQRLPTTVDGHQAVRVTATSDGDGLLPAGIDTTTWLVDLDIGTDGSGGTLVGQVTDTDDVDYDGAVGVLDRMARSADIDPDGDAPPATTVARMEGGGSPYAVTHEGSCFALYEGAQQGPRTAEVCDIGAGEPLSAGVLRSEERELAVGLTTTQVDVVRLRANTDAQRAVATVTVGDGARAYALELSGTEATVVAETFDGQELGSVTVLPE